MYKMQRVDPALIQEESVKLNEQKLEAISKSFTDPNDPEYKTTSQFIHMYAWAQHFATVCKISRGQRIIEDKLEEGKKNKLFFAEQKIRYTECLEDLKIFELDKIQEERDIIF